MSPFFATYGYEALDPVLLEPGPTLESGLNANERATKFVEKVKQITDLC
jgi:hypothetical protein